MMNKNIHLIIVLTMLTTAPLELPARTLGMVADNTNNSVTVFNADSGAVLGTLPIPAGVEPAIGDVLITPDLTRGFVTYFGYGVSVIDLTTSPPTLAGGTNPIPISNAGEDLAISRDGQLLLVSDGSNLEPISVINIATQAEVSTFSTGSDTNSLDVCSNGSVLITSVNNGTVLRLTLSGSTLTDTGEVLSVFNPWNIYCAPDSVSGVVIGGSGDVTSFTIPLLAVDTRPLSGGSAMAGAINPAGNLVFARSSVPGLIDVFGFTPTTGALGASPLLTFPVAETPTFYGVDQVALHPDGGKLFVSEAGAPSAVNMYDPSTGALLASITDPAIVRPTGVTVVAQTDPCTGTPPAGAILGTNGSNQLNGTPGNDIIFGLGGNDQINGRGGNDLICGGAGSDLITGGAGDDVLDVKDGVSGNDSVNGGAGNDVCTGDPGDALSNCNP